jgi:hypothetical protein
MRRGSLAMLLFTLALALPSGCLPGVESPQALAMRAVQGDEGEKGAGPLAPIGYDLALLYYEYRAFLRDAPPDAAFSPSDRTLRVTDGRVVVDALARSDAHTLATDLVALGHVRTTVRAGVVSGSLPIDVLPDAARLASLRSLRPTRVETR